MNGYIGNMNRAHAFEIFYSLSLYQGHLIALMERKARWLLIQMHKEKKEKELRCQLDIYLAACIINMKNPAM